MIFPKSKSLLALPQEAFFVILRNVEDLSDLARWHELFLEYAHNPVSLTASLGKRVPPSLLLAYRTKMKGLSDALFRDIENRGHDTTRLYGKIACSEGLTNLIRALVSPRWSWVRSDAALFAIARTGRMDDIKLFAKNSSSDYEIILEAAARLGRIDMAKFAMDNRAWARRHAMLTATTHGHFEFVGFMLKNGARACKSALVLASQRGYGRIVKLMVDGGVSDLGDSIDDAIWAGHANVVYYLAGMGARCKIGSVISAIHNGHISTALVALGATQRKLCSHNCDDIAFRAAARGDTSVIDRLVQIHDGPFPLDKAVTAAACRGHFQAARHILALCTVPIKPLAFENTLDAACSVGNAEFVKALVEKFPSLCSAPVMQSGSRKAAASGHGDISDFLAGLPTTH